MLCIKESLLIQKDKPKLNIRDRIMPLISLNDRFTMTGTFLSFVISVSYYCKIFLLMAKLLE